MVIEASSESVSLVGGVPVGVICWHIHHGILIEITDQPMADRVRFIRRCKNPKEVEVRLKWMRPVWGQLPASVVDAGRRLAVEQAKVDRAGTNKSYNLLGDASDAWNRAVKWCRESIEKLHEKECPGCPCDGKTLFPKRR